MAQLKDYIESIRRSLALIEADVKGLDGGAEDDAESILEKLDEDVSEVADQLHGAWAVLIGG